jgi:hypothetical protein
MTRLRIRGVLAFGLPIVAVLALYGIVAHATGKPQNYYYLAAGPLCGLIGGMAYSRRITLSVVLGLCFGTIGLMFSLQEARSPLFSDVVWTGLVSAFLFWVAGGCAMLALPAHLRFDGAMTMALPGLLAGLAFQFFYGPAHFLFDLGSRQWWGDRPWEHFILWIIAGAGSGWLIGSELARREDRLDTRSKTENNRNWAIASLACALFAVIVGAAYFGRSRLPLGLFNSLSPIGAAADWFWGWGVLAVSIAIIAVGKRTGRRWSLAALGIAVMVIVASFRINADPWKTKFNASYAERLLREQPRSGDAIYVANLILAQTALDRNDVSNAKQYLLQAATTPSAHIIEQNGLDVSVARVLFDRGERDTVVEYLNRGRRLWPQGTQIINRWQAAIRAGRRPNFVVRPPNQQQQQQQN